jgi:hypothetical protein
MKLDLGPRDLCPLGHGPMWWWPTGGTWACQRPTCEVTEPVTQAEIDARRRDYFREAMWIEHRYAMLHRSPKAFPFPVSTA